MTSYEPRSYWSDRLSNEFSLKGVGHASYSVAYNRWLYRQKGRVLAKATAGLARDSKAFDVGAGVGWVVGQLEGHGFRVDGCDIAEVAVDGLQKSHEGSFYRVTVGSEPIPVADASYDLVTFMDVAYHIVDNELWSSALSDMLRILRPGGRLVTTDQFGERDEIVTDHVRFRSRDSWLAAVADTADLSATMPLYRWLSRNPGNNRFSRSIPGGLRGALEYGLEHVGGHKPVLRCMTWTKR